MPVIRRSHEKEHRYEKGGGTDRIESLAREEKRGLYQAGFGIGEREDKKG